MTFSLLTAHAKWPVIWQNQVQYPVQLIYNDLLTADSSSRVTCSLLTAHLQWPAHCWQVIFSHLKLWVAVARHNFKLVKIYNDLLTADSSCKMTWSLLTTHLQSHAYCWQLIYNDLITADSPSTMTLTADSPSTITCSLLTAHIQWPTHCWQLIYNDLITADSPSTMACSLLTSNFHPLKVVGRGSETQL